jgi:tetratricopeptide (TPR) repeat protein
MLSEMNRKLRQVSGNSNWCGLHWLDCCPRRAHLKTHSSRQFAHRPNRDKTAEQYFQEGKALLEAKRYDEAIEAYRHCIALDPKHPLAHSNIGVALYRKGQLG